MSVKYVDNTRVRDRNQILLIITFLTFRSEYIFSNFRIVSVIYLRFGILTFLVTSDLYLVNNLTLVTKLFEIFTEQ